MNDELFAYQAVRKLQHHFNPTILPVRNVGVVVIHL